MITLRAFLLVMSIVGLRHASLNAEMARMGTQTTLRDDSVAYPDALIAACVIFCVVGKFLAVFSALHAEVAGRKVAWQRFTRLRTGLEWSWILVQALALPASDVAAWLVNAEVHGAASCWMIALWFLPSLIFLSAVEYATAELDHDMQRKSESLGHTWLERVRLGVIGQVLTCVLPMWLVLALNDLVSWLLPSLSESVRVGISLLGLASVCLTLAPLWMRWSMGARPLAAEDPLNVRVKQFCTQLHVATPQLLMVGPRGNWCGAALVGWTPLFRQLWVGQALLTTLSDRQLDMVLLHELAHLKRGHCWWRIVPLLSVAVGLVACVVGSGAGGFWQLEQQWLVLLLAAGLAWMLGWISRQCELDADRVACLQATATCAWTDGRPQRAAAELASALTALQDPDRPTDSRHWLHPSLKARLNCLSGSL